MHREHHHLQSQIDLFNVVDYGIRFAVTLSSF